MKQLVASRFSLPRKLLSALFVAGVVVLSLALLQIWSFEVDWIDLFAKQRVTNSSLEIDGYLDALIRTQHLSPGVEWAAWNIQSIQNQEAWTPFTRVSHRFQPKRSKFFDQRNRESSALHAIPTLALPSPHSLRPGQFNASRYLIGVPTTYRRLMENSHAVLKSWQWWLAVSNSEDGDGAHIVVMLDRADEKQIQAIEAALEELGISGMVYNERELLSSATRYTQLAGELHAYGSALAAVGIAKEWFVLLDDDVFFPSLSYLDEKLAEYDAGGSVHVGIPREQESSGGDVVILSRDGLGRYASLSCTEKDPTSDTSSHARAWSSVLHDCLTTNGRLPMSVLPGLADSTATHWSANLKNDARPMVLRSSAWGGIDLARATLVAEACGEACFLQRFLFRDGWVLVNGVSISQLQHPVTMQDTSGPKTDVEDAPNARRETEAQLQLDAGRGARHVWNMLDSAVDEYGTVWQAYVKREARGQSTETVAEVDEALDFVILLLWNHDRI